jgi:Pyruvate/2-oxoacid:ferredoxin oxidoreductase gamma subunit
VSFFSKLFLGGKTAETVATTLKDSAAATFSILDESFETSQEKTEAKAKAVEAYIEIYKTTMQESTGTAEARRWFLQTITNFIMAMAVCALLAMIFQRPDIKDAIVEVVKDFQLGWAFVAAVGFYFMTHVAQAIMGKPKK